MTKTELPISLKDSFKHPGNLIRRSHQIFASVFEDEFGVHDISPVQYMVLKSLSELGALDHKSISGLAATDKASCTRLVARLEDKGLLISTVDSQDQRRKLVKLTRKTRELLPLLDACADRVEARLMERLERDERAEFLRALQVFTATNNALSRAPHNTDALNEQGRQGGELVEIQVAEGE